MRPLLAALALPFALTACAVTPQNEFVPSRKNATELRSMQVRQVPADADTAMRGVVATLHDLGYRITRIEPEARTISATRRTALRMAVVVQPRGPAESTVRANASLVALAREAQIDSAEFYQRNFFEPLGATLGRTPAAAGDDETAPAAPRPVAEINTARQREAAAQRQSPAVSGPATGGPAR